MGAIRAGLPIYKKLEVIEWIEREGECVPSRAAAHFGAKGWKVDARMCRRWWNQRNDIREAANCAFRLPGAGRKPILGSYEKNRWPYSNKEPMSLNFCESGLYSIQSRLLIRRNTLDGLNWCVP